MHRGTREGEAVSSLTRVGTLFREFVGGVALWAEVEGASGAAAAAAAAAVKRVRWTKEQRERRRQSHSEDSTQIIL